MSQLAFDHRLRNDRRDSGSQFMTKPKKTALQLETIIKAGVSEIMLWPNNAVVSIWPDANGWKAVCHTPNPVMDKECVERVRAEAERLKLEFDLDLEGQCSASK